MKKDPERYQKGFTSKLYDDNMIEGELAHQKERAVCYYNTGVIMPNESA